MRTLVAAAISAALLACSGDDAETGFGDVEIRDAEASDARAPDAATPDADVPDADAPDADPPDAGPDIGLPDVSLDVGASDVNPDVGVPDVSPDIGAPDADTGPPPCGPAPAPGSVVYVDAAAAAGGDGTSWLTAFDDLAAALAAAAPDQEVWVAMGEYAPVEPVDPANVTNAERDASFTIPDGVAVLGGFVGGEGLECERDPGLNPTILTGDLAGDDADSDGDGLNDQNLNENSRHVVRFGAVSDETRLAGFIIQGGYADSGTIDGGGVLIEGGTPQLSGLEIRDNHAPSVFGRGGGLASIGGGPALERVEFARNQAGANGGAVRLFETSVEMIDCTFDDNHGVSTGGAVYAQGEGSLVIRRGVFVGNTVATGGGGNGAGGALAIDGPNTLVVDSRFEGNEATLAGGALSVRTGVVTVTHSVFDGNDGGRRGGAVFVGSFVGDTVLQYSVFANNVAGLGGALALRGGVRLAHSTFAANRAEVRPSANGVGGAIYVQDREGPLRAYGCVVWGNTAETANDGLNGSPASFSNSILQGSVGSPWDFAQVNRGSDGGGVRDEDPGFVDLANPAGPDGVLGTGDDGLRLTAASPAVDTAAASDMVDVDRDGRQRETVADVGDVDNDGDVTEDLPFDLIGNTRREGRTVDMGAYETRGISAVTTTIYVDADAAGADDGSSWTDAFGDLVDAIDAARAGDEIWVAAGDYVPGADRDASFFLKPGVAIYGGFAGTETQRSARNPDPATNGTVLTAEIAGAGASDNVRQIVVASGVGNEAVLDGFTLTRAFDGNSQARGGGMYMWGGTPQLENLHFVSNQSGTGGGLYATARAEPELRRVVFDANVASQGGGIYAFGSHVRVVDALFVDNVGSVGGGGILVTRGRGTISHAIFLRNDASASPSSPGPGGGGVLNAENATVDISHGVFVDNIAVHGGGVGTFNAGTTRIAHSTFVGNSAAFGGAVSSWNGSTVSLVDSILWNNVLNATRTDPSGPQLFTGRSGSSGGTLDVLFSLVEGGVGGADVTVCDRCTVNDDPSNLSADPQFEDVDAPAGLDGTLGTADDGLRLTAASPATNAGTITDLIDLDGDGDLTEDLPDVGDIDRDGDFDEPVPRDILGAARVNGSATDMGAYER
jgi:hypothetical protein